MEFEWGDEKAKSNLEDHKISFDEAITIFDGPVLTKIDTRREYGEVRKISMGLLGDEVVLVVVHTDRGGKTRLISARKANKRERIIYYGYLEKTLE